MISFMSQRNYPKSVALFIAILSLGTLFGLGAYTFYFAEGAAYLSDDPKVCANCHVMREHYDGWQKSSHHANATCNSCHTPTNIVAKYISKANNGFWHSKGFTFYDYHEPIRIRESNRKILLENCVNCHEKFVAEIHQGNGDKSQLNCIHCHAAVGHGPTK